MRDHSDDPDAANPPSAPWIFSGKTTQRTADLCRIQAKSRPPGQSKTASHVEVSHADELTVSLRKAGVP